MTHSEQLDALVVGAGPTGLAMASDLLRHGMKVRIVDQASEPTNLSKAVVLMPRTLEEFHPRGISKKALEHGERAISASAYSKGRLIFHTRYDNLTSDYDFLTNIPQADTERVLREHLEELGGKVEWKTKVVDFTEHDDGIQANLEDEQGHQSQVSAAYLCGCDGAHSMARHHLNFDFHGKAYHDNWWLADVKIDWRYPHGHTYVFFQDDGLFAVFPMPEGRDRIYFVEPESEKLGRPPTIEEFQVLADRFVPDGCRIYDPRWLSEFHCHHRKVKHYTKGRVHLAGDAAHIHSPETGLGMNTGIQDSYNLAWKIAYVRKGWAHPSLLESYDQERSFVGQQVVKFSDTTHKIYAQFGTLAHFIREPMWRFLNHYYQHHNEKIEEAVQLKIRYPASQFVMHHGHPEKDHALVDPVEAGMRLLNAELQPVQGTVSDRTRLYDIVDAKKFHLLILTGAHPQSELLEEMSQIITTIEPHREYLEPVVIFGGQDPHGFTDLPAKVYLDPTQHLHYNYAAQKGGLFLVRPDLYIGYSAHGWDRKQWVKYLDTLFTK